MKLLPDIDRFWTGALLGLAFPLPVTVILSGILKLVQSYAHLSASTRQADMFLLSLAVNLLVMRYYFVKKKYEHTGRGIMIVTIALVVIFFIFLKKSSLTIF